MKSAEVANGIRDLLSEQQQSLDAFRQEFNELQAKILQYEKQITKLKDALDVLDSANSAAATVTGDCKEDNSPDSNSSATHQPLGLRSSINHLLAVNGSPMTLQSIQYELVNMGYSTTAKTPLRAKLSSELSNLVRKGILTKTKAGKFRLA